MNGTGKVSFARKTRRHATGPAVRTGAGGLEICGQGVRGAVLVGWCLGVQVCGKGPAAAPSCFPGCIGPRRQTAKAGGRSFIPGSIQAAKVDGEGRRPFLHFWITPGGEGERRRPAPVPDPLTGLHIGAWVRR